MSDVAAPAVSVLLAVYNAEKYVETAVRSVLSQTYRDLELVLVDDGSSDGSVPILQRLAAEDDRIRLFVRPNKGIPATANEMLALARGRYLSLMDHDDIKLPDCIAREVEYLEAHPECAAVGALSSYIDEAGRITKVKRDHSVLLTKVTKRNGHLSGFPPDIPSIANPSALVRAEAMQKAGCYRLNMPYAHDTDLWFRLSRIGEIHRLNEVLLHYRIHTSNTTITHRERIVQHEIIAVLSAIARHHHLDDETLISGFNGAENYAETIDAYKDLIDERYPVETYLLFRAVGNRVPAVVGETDFARVLELAIKHALSFPISAAEFQLLRRTLSRAFHSKACSQPAKVATPT